MLGVDFGTTNTVVAAVLDDGVEVLTNDIGCRLTPSCVHLQAAGGPDQPLQRQVGEAALRLAVSEPANTVRNVKIVLGLSEDHFKVRRPEALGSVEFIGTRGGEMSFKIGGAPVSPEEVVATLLVDVRKAAEEQTGRAVGKAVMTVPAYFTSPRRAAICNAARLAGLQVLQLVNETTAAAAAYAHDREGRKRVLVLDVGGGGGSVAIAEVEDNKVSVLFHSGLRLPGGNTLDRIMVEHLVEAAEQQAGGTREPSDRDREILRSQWDKAKPKLSRVPQAALGAYLPDLKLDFRMDVNRAEFEAQCDVVFEKIVSEVKHMLLNAKVKAQQLDDVVLVGGSTRLPLLRDLVQRALGVRVLCKALNPDEAVAVGAALLAAGDVTIRQEVASFDTKVCETYAGAAVHCEIPLGATLPAVWPAAQFAWKELQVKQGYGKDSGTIYNGKVSGVSSFSLDASGLFSFANRLEGSVKTPLIGCLPEESLDALMGKMKESAQHKATEEQRIHAKNAYEETLLSVLAVKIPEDDPVYDEAAGLRGECEQQLQWLRENCAADRNVLDKRRESVKNAVARVNAYRVKEKARVEAREKLRAALNGVVLTEVHDGDFQRRRASELKEFCAEKRRWLSDHQESQDVYDGLLSRVEEEQRNIEFLRKSERERIQARDLYVGDLKKTVASQIPQDVVQRKAMDLKRWCLNELDLIYSNPGTTKEEYTLRRRKLLDDVNAMEVERRRNRAREELQCQLKKLIDMKPDRDDELGRQFVQEMSALYKRGMSRLESRPEAKEEDILRLRHDVIADADSVIQAYGHERKKEEARRIESRNALERKLLEGLNMKLGAVDRAFSVVVQLRETCSKSLDWLKANEGAPRLHLDTLRNFANTEIAEACQQVEAEKRRVRALEQLKTTVIKQQETCPAAACSVLSHCLSWLESHAGVSHELLDALAGSVSRMMALFYEARDHEEKAEVERTAAAAAAAQAQAAAGTLLRDLGVQPPAEDETMEVVVDGAGGQEPASLLAANGLGPSWDGQSQCGCGDVTRRSLAEDRSVEVLKEARRASCIALLVDRVTAPASGRRVVSLSARYVDGAGRAVERPLLSVCDDDGLPAESLKSLADRLVVRFADLCRRAGFEEWLGCLAGVCTAGFGAEGTVLFRAMRKALAETLPSVRALGSGAVSVGQQLADACRAGAASGGPSPARHAVCDFWDALDALRGLFPGGGRRAAVLRAACPGLAAAEEPWRSCEAAVAFLAKGRDAVTGALSALALAEPGERMAVKALQAAVADDAFLACALVCHAVLGRTAPLSALLTEPAGCLALKQKIAALAATVTVSKVSKMEKSIRTELETVFDRNSRSLGQSDWEDACRLRDQIVEVVVGAAAGVVGQFCDDVDELSGVINDIDLALLGLRYRITIPRGTRGLQAVVGEACDSSILASDPDLETVARVVRGSAAFCRGNRDARAAYAGLVRALTAPLLPPAGPRSLDQLREAVRLAECCPPERMADSVVLAGVAL